jgi:hypothetical protein
MLFPNKIRIENQNKIRLLPTVGCITSVGRKQLFPASNGSFRMMTTNHVRDRRRRARPMVVA